MRRYDPIPNRFLFCGLLCLLAIVCTEPAEAEEVPGLDDETFVENGPELESQPSLAESRPTPNRKAVAAEVGQGIVTLDDVLALWGPAWYEVINHVQSGRLDVSEADAKLQEEWQKALETVIRNELLHQEAERDFENRFQKMVDQFLASREEAEGFTRRHAEEKLRRHFQRQIQEQVAAHIDRQIEAAGGMRNLRRVLQERQMTFDEFRDQVRRKGITAQYLQTRVFPLGPIQPRPADIRAFYKEHPEVFAEPGATTFRHILFDNSKRGGENAAYLAAENVYNAIDEGRIGFEEAAKKFSDDPISAARGGLETGIGDDSPRETWLADVRAAAREEKPGEFGPIVLSDRGCHLIVLLKAEPDRVMPFRKAQRIIVEKMQADRWERESQKVYDEIKERARVVVRMQRFPESLSYANTVGRRPKSAPPVKRVGIGADPARRMPKSRDEE